LKQKNINRDQIEIKTMTSNSDTDTWHYNATWHWQCHVAHTGTWHVAFLFFF